MMPNNHAQTFMFCPCPYGQWCRFPNPELFWGDWTWPMKPMRICLLITMGRPVVKENGEQLNRDDSYSLWKQMCGFSFNCYHLPHLNQYSQAWGPINTIKEGKPPWMNVQIQARKLFWYIMVPLASLLKAARLARVGPEQPFPLQIWLWVQEGDFISPEQKARGGSGFGDHISEGDGDCTHTFWPVKTVGWWADHCWERGSPEKPCWGDRLLRQQSGKQKGMSTMHWEHMEWPVAWNRETTGRNISHRKMGHCCWQWPFRGRSPMLHPGSMALAHS